MIPCDLCWILCFPLFVVFWLSLLIIFYYRQLRLQRVKKYEFDNKTVLVITAHPDDECNYYHQGNIRKKELFSSCNILGIPSSHVTVKDHHSLPDDPNIDWDTKIASQIIVDHIKNNQFQMVITFDSYGVSGHSNHIAIYKAVKRLKDKGLLEDVTVYVLNSITMLRKYISLLDLPFSVYSQQMFLSSPQDIILAQKAMYAHRSQLLWFRRLYILFSRFMMINTLEELK